MAPVTRRRSRAIKEVAEENPAALESPKALETLMEPIRRRSKRLSTSPGEEKSKDPSPSSDVAETTPKRRDLAVRTREDESTEDGGRRTQIEVQIPSSNSKRPPTSSVADSPEDNGPEEPAEEELAPDPGSADPGSASKQLQEEASQKLASQSVEPEPTPGPKKKNNKLVVPDNASQPVESEPPSQAKKSKHVVFGDDDDVEKYVAAAAETEKDAKKTQDDAAQAEEKEEDSDDEAPEAVSTQAAAKQTLESVQAASEAAEKHAASLKRKRQERDNLFKEQADKRKRARKADQKQSGPADEDAEVEKATKGRRRAGKLDLPGMLPAEFLTDSSGESEDETALRAVKKPKKQKINFETAVQTLGNEGKRPRDQVVGTTRYRVLADQGDPRLAPRMNKNARHVKEDLLKRRRAAATPNKKKGFFVRR